METCSPVIIRNPEKDGFLRVLSFSQRLKAFQCLEHFFLLVLSLSISGDMVGWPVPVPLWLAEGLMLSAGR